eukprot:SAG31_NODE_1844_length_7106_cov_3.064935_4_plen_68_part_00
MAKQQEERDRAAKQKAEEKEIADVQRHLNFQLSKSDIMDVLNHIESSLGSHDEVGTTVRLKLPRENS